jgi:hypothetical protein
VVRGRSGANILKHECVIVRGFTPPRGNNSRRRQNRYKSRKNEAYLLKLLDGTLVNSTALVDQVTCVGCQYIRER